MNTESHSLSTKTMCYRTSFYQGDTQHTHNTFFQAKQKAHSDIYRRKESREILFHYRVKNSSCLFRNAASAKHCSSSDMLCCSWRPLGLWAPHFKIHVFQRLCNKCADGHYWFHSHKLTAMLTHGKNGKSILNQNLRHTILKSVYFI